jgi:hypothetical protein
MAANAPTSGSLWNTIDLESNSRVQVFAKPLEKSPNDDRQYRIIRLANNLEALLVHDPDADKAAASLDVAVGSLSDPVRASILLDHLLCQLFDRMICLALPTSANIFFSWFDKRFTWLNLHRSFSQGTDKYPKENDYAEVCLPRSLESL